MGIGEDGVSGGVLGGGDRGERVRERSDVRERQTQKLKLLGEALLL